MLIPLLVITLIGYTAVTSDTGSSFEWAQEKVATIESDVIVPTVVYPKGAYLTQSVKPATWAAPVEIPERKNFTPVAASGLRWVQIKERPRPIAMPPAPKKQSRNDLISTTAAATQAPAAEDDTDGLGSLGKRNSEASVNTDEILSYFGDKGAKKSSHEELGNFNIPNQQPVAVPAAARPGLEIR